MLESLINGSQSVQYFCNKNLKMFQYAQFVSTQHSFTKHKQMERKTKIFLKNLKFQSQNHGVFLLESKESIKDDSRRRT